MLCHVKNEYNEHWSHAMLTKERWILFVQKLHFLNLQAKAFVLMLIYCRSYVILFEKFKHTKLTVKININYYYISINDIYHYSFSSIT
jgi:hypothetical protein